MTHGTHCKQHDHCEHCLHYCGTCDKPYCCKCGKEWPAHQHNPWYWVNTTMPATSMTWTSSPSIDLNAEVAKSDALYSFCDGHVHKV